MDTTYRILERRVFALPKIALFPAVVARHPRMAVIALPALLAVDALKGKVVARLSAKVEELRREVSKVKVSKYTVPLCWVWGPSIAVLWSCQDS